MKGASRRRSFGVVAAWVVAVAATALLVVGVTQYDRIMCHVNYPSALDALPGKPGLEVPLDIAAVDGNSNGVLDALDIVAGARLEVSGRTVYDGAYFDGGYPPDGRGVCTDVVWRALAAAGYDLKSLVDADIRANLSSYPRVGGRPDPNIDFRRVPNLVSFFARHALTLTTDVKAGDVANLINWQPGDIVVFGKPTEHVGVVSDLRRADGVPLVIHNAGPWASESDILLTWPTALTHHFRFPWSGLDATSRFPS